MQTISTSQAIEIIASCTMDDGGRAHYSRRFIWVSQSELTDYLLCSGNTFDFDDPEIVLDPRFRDSDGIPYVTTRRLYRKHAGLRARVASVLTGRVVA